MPKRTKEEIEKALVIKDQQHYYVAEKNTLIQDSTFKLKESHNKSLSLTEKKILLYLISKIKPTDTDIIEQTININEFCEVCGFSKTYKSKYDFNISYNIIPYLLFIRIILCNGNCV